MDKPEYCYAYVEKSDGVRIHGASWWSPDLKGVVKFHITYNEAGEVVRLERVEE